MSSSQQRYEFWYLLLTALFIAALVSCNLIFNKFWSAEIPIVGDVVAWLAKVFLGEEGGGATPAIQQSVGLLPYPVTFLVTDILSEVYGRRRANQVVSVGFVASLFVLLILVVGDAAEAAPWSPVNDQTFHLVFGQAWAAFGASMVAYLCAQYMDIRVFHFWRRLTKGRHLWLRNNASTIVSQVLDTGLVLFLLASLPKEDPESGVTFENLPRLFIVGVTFKVACALMDTPLFYLAVAWFKRKFPEEMARAHQA